MKHAHRHVAALLALPISSPDHPMLQLAVDGSLLTADALKRGTTFRPNLPILVTDTPESIGMTLPRSNNNSSRSKQKPVKRLSVRDIADTVGHAVPVHVIDVEHQEELEGWVMYDLVEYFEDEERMLQTAASQRSSQRETQPTRQRPQRRRRQATFAKHRNDDRPRVINQISFEFSHTPLRRMVQSPTFVRELDWIDHAWSPEWRAAGHYPSVQYYCLTSSAGCYTDFHLDFGGTSVWYHVASGSKEFVLIEPTAQNLQIYEQWLCRKDQSVVFLPDLIEDKSQIIKVKLQEDQTFFIPSGWVHAVYTPDDSLVFGGNFLHGLDMQHQLNSNSIEVRARVKERFRFPHFVPLQFYTGAMYLDKLRRGDVCQREVDELPALMDALKAWWNVYVNTQPMEDEPSPAGAAVEIAKMYECDNFDEFLSLLRGEHARIVRDGIPAKPLKIKQPRPYANRSAAGSPRVKLKLSSKVLPTTIQSDNSSPKSEFRIQLSQSSLKAVSLPKGIVIARSKAREDVLDDCDLPDEEWTPGGNERRGAPRRPQSSPTAKKAVPNINNKRIKAAPSISSASPSKKLKTSAEASKSKHPPNTTARQRLMTKFR